ncbi:MAG: methyltransferase domain-containing protein [Gammaproteobacteria bacterium]|nr:methyltransferase domain-containing protein [Gammaproteobacteria bacterium]
MSPQPDQPSGYIHSFSQAEQERLVRQGVFLEPYVFPSIDYSGCRQVLEIGCGVGAQIAVLLRRWPELVVTGVDRAAVQLEQAREFLESAVVAGRVRLFRGDGTRLPFPDRSFDGAFVCWVLEHAGDPVGILKEIRRVLAPGGVLYATEVFNAGMYTWPVCPATERYWCEFNRYQRDLGGDPDVGAKLANLALRAGFSDITLRYLTPQLDRRMSDPAERREFMAMWTRLLLSAAPALQAEGRIPAGLADDMARELQALAANPEAVFMYMAVQVRARD